MNVTEGVVYNVRKSWIVASLMVLVAGLLIAVSATILASEPQPLLSAVITANSYTGVTLQFSADVYRLADNADLKPGDFALTGAGVATIASVSRADSGRSAWTVTFSESVVPHTAQLSLSLAANIGNAGGSVAPFTKPVPFSGSDLAALAGFLPNLTLLPKKTVELPLVGDWLASDHTLSSLVTGLSSLPSDTQAALENLLTTHGITATYAGRSVILSFSDASAASSHSMSGSAGVSAVNGTVFDLSLAGSVTADVYLSGSLQLNVGQDGSVSVANSAGPAISLRSTSTFSPTGRLGVVDVSATAQANLDATISITGFSPAPTLSVSGDATLDLTQVSVSGTSLNFTLGGTNPLLKVYWPDLGQVTVNDVNGNPADNIQVLVDKFDDLSLRNFTRVSVNQILSGLSWFTGWLTEVQNHDAMGLKLPVVGQSVGDLAQVANSLAEPVLALSDIATLSGDLSAQGLINMCQISSAELDALVDRYAESLNVVGGALDTLRARLQGARATCANLLSNVTITAQEITYTLSVSHDLTLFEGIDAATLDLGIGDDLAGIKLSATTGRWDTAQATTSFNLTVGIKLVPTDQLGIPPGTESEAAAQLGHRFFVQPGQVASAAVNLQGNNFKLGARLGFLDLGIQGHAAFNPSMAVSLVDPGAGSGTPKDDGKIDLYEMAQAADAKRMSSLVSLAVNGDVDAAFTLDNGILFGTTPRSLTIHGPVAHPDQIQVTHNLGDALKLKAITPAQAIRMMAGIAKQLAAMGDTDLMSRSIPFVDVSFQDAVDFSSGFAEVAHRIEQRDPQDISSLEAALNEALGAAGMPGSVTVGVTAEELTLTFNATKSVTQSYPFSFEGGGLSFAPADGGASVSATAGVTFNPTVGILFTGSGDLDERIFLQGVGPQFRLMVQADAFGSVHLGPMSAGLQGRVELGNPVGPVPAQLAVTLKGADSQGRITLRRLSESLGSAGTVGDVIGVDYSGRVYGNLSLDTVLGTGTITVQGDLANPSAIAVEPHLNFDLKLDLGTLVYGTVETSRFMGRLMEQSQVVTSDLPLLGKELRTLTTVGTDLRAAADKLDQLWQSANDDNAFVGDITATLEDVLCPTDRNCVEVTLLPAGATLATATGIEVRLSFAKQGTASTTLDAGVNLKPVFQLDMSLAPEVTYGYNLDLVLGLNVADGFYVRAGGGANTDLLQLYARLQMQNISASASILGINANVAGGTASVSGTLGPNGNAGGFAVSIPDKIRLRDLSNRRRNVDQIAAPRFDATISASLPLTTAVENLLTLQVPIHLQTKATSNGKPETTLTLGCSAAVLPDLCTTDQQITLDASSLVRIIEPALEPFNAYNPLARDEIKTVLNTNIPALEMTVRNLLKQATVTAGKQDEWDVIEFLLDLSDKLDELKDAAGSGNIELGWVRVSPDFHYYKPAFAPLAQANAAEFSSALGTIGTTSTGGARFLRFPILDNPGDAIKLLLGGDQGGTVTFMEFAPNEIIVGPSINWERELLALDVGFLKGGLSVAFRAHLGLALHIGFGYDSSWLASGHPIDGFYLIDYPGYEISLGGSVQGAIDGYAEVAWGIASVRFHGSAGVSALVGLDLFSDSIALPASTRNQTNDPPRLHLTDIETIAKAYRFPGLPEGAAYPCIFKLGVKLDANISFGGRAKVLGITVFNESYSDSWVFVDKTFTCSIIEKAAHIDQRRLILNGGTYADRRFDGGGDLAEEFVVRPSGSDEVEVVVNTYSLTDLAKSSRRNSITTKFKRSDFDVIYAELGAGDDRVEIDSNLTIPSILYGGTGDNLLIGGAGDDLLVGGPGKNILKGTAGNNQLIGGEGNDELWVGTGDDLLEGGGGTNKYVMKDVWGSAAIADASGSAILDFDTTQALTGTASFFEGSVKGAAGSLLTYSIDEVMEIRGGSADDTFTINRYAPQGFKIDLRGGNNNTVTVLFAGADRTISVTDTGGGTTLIARGTAGSDTFLFRANGPASGPATSGFVALLTPNQVVDRVNYDNSISLLKVEERSGANRFVLDDTAAPLEINGGDGGSTFQVGQIFGNPRTPPYVPAGNEVRTRNVEGRGPMSLGVSHPTTLRGGHGNDHFTVFSNVAPLTMEGVSGDNVFVLRAFIAEGSVQAKGGDGNDRFEYVPNEHASIDGGDGFNTLVIIGTELSDGFVVDSDGMKVCPQYSPSELPAWSPVQRLPNPNHERCASDASYTGIQQMIVHGLHGNDAYWVRSTSPTMSLRLFGGTDGATFLIGNNGDLTGIQGPVHVDGEADPEFDARVPAPIVLPGEDGTPGREPVSAVYDDQLNRLVVDGSAHTSGETGTLTTERVFGLGMGDDVTIMTASGPRAFPGGVTYRTIGELKVLMGSGDDQFTVESTNGDTTTFIMGGPGDDDIAVRSIFSPTTVNGQAGSNTIRAGTHAVPGGSHPDHASTLTRIAATLHVIGGTDGHDRVVLDASGTDISAVAGEHVDVWQGRVTQLSMPGMVTHESLGLLDIYMTNGKDVANVRGTSTTTAIHGLDGDDRIFISDAAEIEVGQPTPPLLGGRLVDIAGDVQVQAGEGKNLLMVSDRDSSALITGAVLTADRMEGFARGAITYNTTGTGTFAGGITLWTGSGADQIDVRGARRDGDPATLAWEGRTEGGPRTITTLNTGAGDDTVIVSLQKETEGFSVLNTGAGDDTVDGSASTLGFIAFGGSGNDEITTGSGDDIVFGDHGRIEYCAGPTVTRGYHGGVESCDIGIVTRLGDETVASLNDGIARRPARIYSIDAGASGDTDHQPYAIHNGEPIWPTGFNNRIHTGAGDDIAFGGPGSDLITDETGRNVLVGDHGEVWRVAPSALGGRRTIRTNDPFINVTVLTDDIAYVVNIAYPDKGGDDVILGGSGRDWIFGGPGDDSINGNDGDDIIWGGDRHDIIAGGRGDDRIYSGAGDDVIDLKLSTWRHGLHLTKTDPAWWKLVWYVAPAVDKAGDQNTPNGSDIVYGGTGRDILQADLGAGGPKPGDRLLDWYGEFNLHLTPRGPYGAGMVLRQPSPDHIEKLLQLAHADGAYNVRVETSSGWRQLSLVTKDNAKDNRTPPHPDHPGNFAGF